jgi:dTDP-4-dehydrorhamnose 3,5-epimerase-like enzyme
MAVLIKQLRVKVDEESKGARCFEIQGMQQSGLFGGQVIRDIVLQTIRPHRPPRGNHYHKIKTEWFLPIRGFAVLSWHEIGNEPRKGTEIMVADFQNPKLFEIQPNTCHAVENKSEEDFYMISFSTVDFDEKNPDNPRC